MKISLTFYKTVFNWLGFLGHFSNNPCSSAVSPKQVVLVQLSEQLHGEPGLHAWCSFKPNQLLLGGGCFLMLYQSSEAGNNMTAVVCCST